MYPSLITSAAASFSWKVEGGEPCPTCFRGPSLVANWPPRNIACFPAQEHRSSRWAERVHVCACAGPVYAEEGLGSASFL